MTLQATTTRSDAGGLRKKLAGGIGVVLSVVLLAVAGILIWTRSSGDVPDTSKRVYMCAETGKSFRHTLEPGETTPVMSPYSNQRTGYPAEECYWTADGKAKKEPTYVLLNKYIGSDEPTICPDCGRVVKPHNPLPPPALLEEALKGP